MLKERLDALSKEHKEQLSYAFEHSHAHYIDLGENAYIGVNVERIKFLRPTESAGNWSYGEIISG